MRCIYKSIEVESVAIWHTLFACASACVCVCRCGRRCTIVGERVEALPLCGQLFRCGVCIVIALKCRQLNRTAIKIMADERLPTLNRNGTCYLPSLLPLQWRAPNRNIMLMPREWQKNRRIRSVRFSPLNWISALCSTVCKYLFVTIE